METKRRELEVAMNALADRADSMMGQDAIAPDRPLTTERPVEAGIGD